VPGPVPFADWQLYDRPALTLLDSGDTGASGSVTLHLPNGDYRLCYQHPGFVDTCRDFTVHCPGSTLVTPFPIDPTYHCLCACAVPAPSTLYCTGPVFGTVAATWHGAGWAYVGTIASSVVMAADPYTGCHDTGPGDVPFGIFLGAGGFVGNCLMALGVLPCISGGLFPDPLVAGPLGTGTVTGGGLNQVRRSFTCPTPFSATYGFTIPPAPPPGLPFATAYYFWAPIFGVGDFDVLVSE
jgi:hypothetical protein